MTAASVELRDNFIKVTRCSMFDEFDFDLDIILGCNSDDGKDKFISTEVSSETSFVTDTDSCTSSVDSDVSTSYLPVTLDLDVANKAVNSSWRKQKLDIPVCRITEDFKNDFKNAVNPLVVDLDKGISYQSNYKKRLKCREKEEGQLATLLSSPKTSTVFKCPEETELDKFALLNGSLILPKDNQSSDFKCWELNLSGKDMKEQRVQIHHASVDWTSYWLMKSMCEGNIQPFVYSNGNILLPKVQKRFSSKADNQRRRDRRSKRRTKEFGVRSKSPGKSSSRKHTFENNSNSTASSFQPPCSELSSQKCISENGTNRTPSLPSDNLYSVSENKDIYHWCDSGEKLIGVLPKNAGDSERDAEDLMSLSEDLVRLSKYPQYKIRYLMSMKRRMNRINSLPLPTQEVDMNVNDSVTEDEKLTMSEFFKESHLTSRYIQIRNHILRHWKHYRPSYVSKTSVRYGLRNHGDVNAVSLIHRYLERIGAINFACDLVHYAVKRDVKALS